MLAGRYQAHPGNLDGRSRMLVICSFQASKVRVVCKRMIRSITASLICAVDLYGRSNTGTDALKLDSYHSNVG